MRGMYVCMSLKTAKRQEFLSFFNKAELVDMVLRILNLEGEQNCIIGSKVTKILPLFFSQKN